MKFLVILPLTFLVSNCVSNQRPKVKGCPDECQEIYGGPSKVFPSVWWQPVPEAEKKSWEISPDSVKPPKVIISKRNELGILSNFAATPFYVEGKSYGSMEGYWQAMKYPTKPSDERWHLAKWPHTRSEVAQMTAFKAKRAGDFASKVMKKNKIDWVSFNGVKMPYREKKKGLFYKMILMGMTAKFEQNPKVVQTLCSTKNLELLPDHSQGKNPPPAWRYHEIWMELRKQKCKSI